MSTLLNDLDRPAPIVLAPTGMVPTRSMTPHVPLTPDEIAADVAAAAAVGITSVHLHARDEDGDPTWEREVYARIVGAVRDKAPEVVINVSTSGRTWSEVERRADCLALDDDLKPDLASLTLSSLNFLTQASVNSPDTIHALARIMLERGIVPELELFDLGMVNYVHVLQRKGRCPVRSSRTCSSATSQGCRRASPRSASRSTASHPGRSGPGPGWATSGSPPSRTRSRREAAYGSGSRTASGSTAADPPGHQPDAGRARPCPARAPRPDDDGARRAAHAARRLRRSWESRPPHPSVWQPMRQPPSARPSSA